MTLLKRTSIFILTVLLFSAFCLAQNIDSAIQTKFNRETGKTTVVLKGIKIPRNKDNFAVGAFFEFAGEKLEKTPCCAGIFFTSMNRKRFRFKENHSLIIVADKEKFSFDDVSWQESAGATAFILAGAAFPEEMFVGMKSEIFQKIASAKNVSIQIGDFKFALTQEQHTGFKKLVEKMSI